ncbi:hypothetical protein B2G71_08185 [Novosphingobium sp. PC22D]|uniref:hypothetical protein n=1 Tax=Novosphingobium sp. PC22D TaxID=1962403 RepID=UPI000BFAE7B1|nr:hypothetical protein [Novosphingobium sp. PC22D]PEQ13397.1 hypothetical protein B2G71_08185 [Novosphingobium sp. PC22D]
MTEPVGAGTSVPRASLRVAGLSLGHHQIVAADALSCNRVICIARGTSPELIDIQHAAEDAGMQFHVMASPQQMAGLVSAADDVFVFAEGLLVEPSALVSLLENGPAVLVQPVETGLGAGFERIDINNASAGALRIPGRLIDQLHQLPHDCEAASALTRIALQSGIPIREVPIADRTSTRWAMIRTDSEALTFEHEWLRVGLRGTGGHSLGGALARAGVLTFGSSMLNAGKASTMLWLTAIAGLLIAGGLAWFELYALAFVICGASWLFVEVGTILRWAERRALGITSPAITRGETLGWLVDVVFAGLLIGAWQAQVIGAMAHAIFAPVMLMLLLRLVRRLFDPRIAAWVSDRAMLALILCVASAAGMIAPVVQSLCVVLAVAGLVIPPRFHG